MKTKLLILLGIIFATVSAVAVAGNLFTSPWSKELSQVQQAPVENTADDVSALLPSLQGIPAEESAYLDDDKAIYVSRPNDLNERASRRKIADNVEHIFGQHGSKILFAKSLVIQDEAGGIADLWLMDTQTGEQKKLVSTTGDASLSPSGAFIATVNPATGGIDLLNGDGVFLRKIATHGALPLFSPDSKKIGYYKFASSSFDRDLQGNALGIAFQDLETGKEVMMTNNSEDGQPVAFSSDVRKLYYNSARTLVYSLWVVDLVSREVRQLTNKNYIPGHVGDPSIKKDPIFSSDEKVIISGSDDGVGILTLDDKGDVSSVKILANGTNPRWFKKDEIIAYRAQGKKDKYWEFVSVK